MFKYLFYKIFLVFFFTTSYADVYDDYIVKFPILKTSYGCQNRHDFVRMYSSSSRIELHEQWKAGKSQVSGYLDEQSYQKHKAWFKKWKFDMMRQGECTKFVVGEEVAFVDMAIISQYVNIRRKAEASTFWTNGYVMTQDWPSYWN